jgi:hypothetical protein
VLFTNSRHANRLASYEMEKQMRQNWIAAVGVALALGLLAGASAAFAEEGPSPEAAPAGEVGLLDASCNSGHVCVWPETFYSGAKGESLCTGGAHPLAGTKASGKNRCANKAVWYRQNGTALVCGNPGVDTPAFGFAINELWIGAEGSRC